jgi:hypothetical protein
VTLASASTGTQTVDTELPAAILAADAMANPTAPQVLGHNMVWNGTTWDRAKGGTAGAGTGLMGVGMPASTIAADAIGNAPLALTDLGGGVRALAVDTALFNGTTWDRQRNNVEGTALTSAARTTATNSADIVNYNGRGILITLDVSAASGTGGITVRIAAKDLASGNYANLNNAPTAVTAISTTTYLLYPGATTGATQTTNGTLPRTFRISVGVGDASSYTYSVSYTIIV